MNTRNEALRKQKIAAVREEFHDFNDLVDAMQMIASTEGVGR
ncbi:hypothetical protein [Shinella daejeonensis]|nr:hypothetical protein [Shinella daejeonensis]